MNRFACAFAGGLLITACTSSAGKSTTPTSRAASPTTSGARTVKAPTTSYGTITGRYYADGGPPPLGYEPPRPIPGTVTVRNVRSHQTYRPRENSAGYFTLIVPVGTYEVAARSSNIAGAMTKIVTVTTGHAVDADLGIHMI